MVAFADESGIHAGTSCYGIGAVSLPRADEASFNAHFRKLAVKHGLSRELKWKRVGRSHGEINMALDLVRYLFKSTARFSCIVVHKRLYNKWRQAKNREDAFYVTYTQLLAHLATIDAKFKVVIDDRSDRYGKQDEVVEKVSNHMAAAAGRDGRIESVTKNDSKYVQGVQVADMLTGIVVAGHRQLLEPGLEMHKGKHVLISRVATMIGWDRLCYDTMPCTDFNVWHFPTEWRSQPATREVMPQLNVPYVVAADL